MSNDLFSAGDAFSQSAVPHTVLRRCASEPLRAPVLTGANKCLHERDFLHFAMVRGSISNLRAERRKRVVQGKTTVHSAEKTQHGFHRLTVASDKKSSFCAGLPCDGATGATPSLMHFTVASWLENKRKFGGGAA